MPRLSSSRKNRRADPIFFFGNFSGEARIGHAGFASSNPDEIARRQKRKIVGENRPSHFMCTQAPRLFDYAQAGQNIKRQ
jgi:hypothetical protein